MKPLWMVFVLALVGTGIWFVFARQQSAPPAELAALELVRGDFNETPSCFSLGAVVAANHLDGSSDDVDAGWTTRVRDEWTLRVDRDQSWRAYTFVKQENFVLPVRVAFSDDLPQLGVEKAIDELLAATANGAATRVSRCGGG